MNAEGVSLGPVRRARLLRKNGTTAENRLWYVLRNRNLGGLKFVRQLPIGPYFADFACREIALIIELDGGQHNARAADERRTAFLCRQGYSVLRFWNNEVLGNRDGVIASISNLIAGGPPPGLRFAPATLSPTGRGTRGAHAASASFVARSFPLPVGERSSRSDG